MRHPTYWKGACADNDKDIVYINDTRFSFEIKTSGQRGVKVFGNRSYGQKLQNVDHAKKDKSGYYLTVNFHKDNLNLIRFGWIDADDWKSQTSSTGQMASLGKEVYQYKLIELIYPYLLDANIFIVNGISKKIENELNEKNIYTLKDLMTSKSLSGKYLKHQTKAIESYGKLLNQ